MPATFAHCLIARKAIEALPSDKQASKLIGLLRMNNHFVTMGATGPDYPYLTDVLSYGVLHLGHNWANRMHYQNADLFIKEGIAKLLRMQRSGKNFPICLSWLCGYVSHVVADSFVHPVVNCILGGPYIFTHQEHGTCELIQDIYIFKEITGTDIVTANPRDANTFGYLSILDDCSDPENLERIHPAIRDFWGQILKAVHPGAAAYFKDIAPDTWHKNYKSRINFVANPSPIFRHIFDLAKAPAYKKRSEISAAEEDKYIKDILLPDGTKTEYRTVFNKTIQKVSAIWTNLFQTIEKDNPEDAMRYVKEWNLDTGVDENKIDLWT